VTFHDFAYGYGVTAFIALALMFGVWWATLQQERGWTWPRLQEQQDAGTYLRVIVKIREAAGRALLIIVANFILAIVLLVIADRA
jgi:hypothetical protein